MASNIRRRDFLKLIGAGAAGLAVDDFRGRAFARAEASTSGGEKPNIIFIMADDLGYADLGCYGQKLIKTPCVDRMAREGRVFTDFYVTQAVCSASRAGLHRCCGLCAEPKCAHDRPAYGPYPHSRQQGNQHTSSRWAEWSYSPSPGGFHCC